jgi:predicted nucleic acid-binding protein
VQFLAPDTAFEEAREHLPEILKRRRVAIAPAMATLDLLAGLVQPVGIETYEPFEDLSRDRIARRDEDDWPILAAALAVGSPI